MESNIVTLIERDIARLFARLIARLLVGLTATPIATLIRACLVEFLPCSFLVIPASIFRKNTTIENYKNPFRDNIKNLLRI